IVANAALSFGRAYLNNYKNIIIAVIAAGMFGLKMNPVIVILSAALLGLMLYNKLSSPIITGQKGDTPSAKPFLLLLLASAIGFVLLFFVNHKVFSLAILMARIDLFAFGGGFASVPLMFHEIVEVRSWMDSSTFLNGIALGQVTPGPIVITSTFVGYLLYGPLGGIIATISMFLPSFLIVVGITPYFERLSASPYFNKAINGILSSFVGLLLTVTVRFALNIPWDIPRILLAAAAFAALLFKIDIIWVVLIGTAISAIIL
ncbi:MAG: chromate efflux transporter, partial [Nitrospirae bacterium]|nr:chromate efflux transporter [Nitrospirota bacterium]